MKRLHITTRRIVCVCALIGGLFSAGLSPSAAGTGEQQAFLASLSSLERAVAMAQAKVTDGSPGVVGLTAAIGADAQTLTSRAQSLTAQDLAELVASGTQAAERVAAVTGELAALLDDPRLAQILSPAQLSAVTSTLTTSLSDVRATTTELNPGLVLWNTLGSTAELAASVAGGPMTLTIPNAEFVAGHTGGGLSVPSDRADDSQRLLYPGYQLTPEGTIELWFLQNGYATNGGEPDDGRFHSFWSPDVRPYETYQGSLLTYQVPEEGWHFDVWDGDGHYVRNTVYPNVTPGEWRHLAFAWSSSGDYTEVYLDGHLLGRAESEFDITPSTLPLQFGFDWDSNGRGVACVLDELKIWSEAKTF